MAQISNIQSLTYNKSTKDLTVRSLDASDQEVTTNLSCANPLKLQVESNGSEKDLTYQTNTALSGEQLRLVAKKATMDLSFSEKTVGSEPVWTLELIGLDDLEVLFNGDLQLDMENHELSIQQTGSGSAETIEVRFD